MGNYLTISYHTLLTHYKQSTLQISQLTSPQIPRIKHLKARHFIKTHRETKTHSFAARKYNPSHGEAIVSGLPVLVSRQLNVLDSHKIGVLFGAKKHRSEEEREIKEPGKSKLQKKVLEV